jgi:hypothetical protein
MRRKLNGSKSIEAFHVSKTDAVSPKRSKKSNNIFIVNYLNIESIISPYENKVITNS